MGLSTAERNRRKRARKKREREEQRKQQEAAKLQTSEPSNETDDIEIVYVAESVADPSFDALEKFQERVQAMSSTLVSEDDDHETSADAENINNNENLNNEPLSKGKLREMIRPTVAALKQQVQHPELVEAHDVSARDPQFLIQMKAVPGTVPVPRHWGRKRKYLQGKRGFEKPPFQLPDFIVKTGITDIRDSVAADENAMSARQKNRSRVAPKMGAIDVDYRTLHDAFFKYQTKPTNLTQFGDLYYEGKELEVNLNVKPGGTLSDGLREALGMHSETAPPPWLLNMQRYGPPPSFPGLKIPGLNAPLPTPECQYGYHPGGWGKPPLDPYGRPLYGGNPFDPPGSKSAETNAAAENDTLVTSDGKTIQKKPWGALPMGDLGEQDESEEESEEESSDDDMDESSEEEEEGEQQETTEGIDSVLPPPPSVTTAPGDLRKQAGDETPAAPKQLYQVIEQKRAGATGTDQVFASEVAYVVPGTAAEQLQQTAAKPPEGAESVLAKSGPSTSKRKRKDDDDDADLDKSFKF